MSWVIAIFTVVVLASALGNLSQTAVNAMLVTICRDFDISETLGQWLTTSYMLTIGIAVPLCSWLMGRFDTKRLTLGCIVGFIIGALVAAFAANFWMLLVGRLVQAITSGILLPLQTTLVMTRFPEGRKATAMGISGIAMGVAPNLGPTIGGAMADVFGWRYFFFMLVAIDVVLLLFCLVAIADKDDRSFVIELDGWSLMLTALGFGGLLLGASNASSFGPASLYVWVPVILGAIFIWLFVRRQNRLEDPFVDMGIFKCQEFVIGFVALCLLYASFMSVTLVIPLFVQNYWGGTATQAGLVLLPGTIVALIMNPLSGVLADKFGSRKVSVVCAIFLVVGAFLASTCDENTPFVLICAFQATRNIGVSGLISPLTAWNLAPLKGRNVADGSVFGLMSRQACSSIGTAIGVMFASGALGFTGAWAYHMAFGFSFVLAAILLVLVVKRVR